MAIKKFLLSVDEELIKELREEAQSDDRSLNNYIVKILKDRKSIKDAIIDWANKIMSEPNPEPTKSKWQQRLEEMQNRKQNQ